MATTITLEGAARTEFGKGAARRMRVANLIPGPPCTPAARIRSSCSCR